jgi:hypothetical protein
MSTEKMFVANSGGGGAARVIISGKHLEPREKKARKFSRSFE